MKQKQQIVLALLFFSLNAISQDIPKFGKIPKEDVAMTIYSNDSSAEAVILFDKGSIEFIYDQILIEYFLGF